MLNMLFYFFGFFIQILGNHPDFKVQLPSHIFQKKEIILKLISKEHTY